MTNKITRIQYFEGIISLIDGQIPEVKGVNADSAKQFLLEEINRTKRHNKGSEKKNAQKAELDSNLRNIVIAYLADETFASEPASGKTCGELFRALSDFESVSKVTHICTALTKEGTILRDVIKSQARYRIA